MSQACRREEKAACTGWASPDSSSTDLAWRELREKDGGSFFPGLRPRLAERPSGERGAILTKEDNGAFEGKAAGATRLAATAEAEREAFQVVSNLQAR